MAAVRMVGERSSMVSISTLRYPHSMRLLSSVFPTDIWFRGSSCHTCGQFCDGPAKLSLTASGWRDIVG
jgi:hypothetical protein